MTLYEILQNSSPMQRNPQAFINKLAEQTNRSKHEIKAEFDKLVSEGKVLAYQDGMYYKVEVVERKAPSVNFDRDYVMTKASKKTEEILEYIYMTCPNFNHFKHAEPIAEKFNINTRVLRDIVLNHNTGLYEYSRGLKFDKVIYGCSKGYAVVSNKAEERELLRSIDIDFYHQIEKRKRIRQRLGLDGQMKMTFEESQYRIVESVNSDLGV